jgi:hypothetical protein
MGRGGYHARRAEATIFWPTPFSFVLTNEPRHGSLPPPKRSERLNLANTRERGLPNWNTRATQATFIAWFSRRQTCQSELFSPVTPVGSAPMASVSATAPRAGRKSCRTVAVAAAFAWQSPLTRSKHATASLRQLVSFNGNSCFTWGASFSVEKQGGFAGLRSAFFSFVASGQGEPN